MRFVKISAFSVAAFFSTALIQPATAAAKLEIDTTTGISVTTSGFLDYNFNTGTYFPATVSHSGGGYISQGTFAYDASQKFATLDTSVAINGSGISRFVNVPNSFYFRENGKIIGFVSYNMQPTLFFSTSMRVVISKYDAFTPPPAVLLPTALIIETGTDYTVPKDALYDYGIVIRMGRSVVGNPAVPEPATWTMLLAGFGIVGAALRRRAKQSPGSNGLIAA